MEKTVILGAGQFGQAALYLLNREWMDVLAFGDNSPGLWGSRIQGVPVMSVDQALALKPDLVLTGVAGQQRAESLAAQARQLGFTGEIVPVHELRRRFDVRQGVLLRMGDRIRERKVPGALAELGVYKGDTARELNRMFPGRPLYLFDTFQGFDEKDIAQEASRNLSQAKPGDFSDTSVQTVLSRLPFPQDARIRQGYFPETAAGLEKERFALVSLDADLYAPVLAGLEFFFPRLSPGGALILHDYGSSRFPGVAQAVKDYETAHGLLPLVPLCDFHGTGVILAGCPPYVGGS